MWQTGSMEGSMLTPCRTPALSSYSHPAKAFNYLFSLARLSIAISVCCHSSLGVQWNKNKIAVSLVGDDAFRDKEGLMKTWPISQLEGECPPSSKEKWQLNPQLLAGADLGVGRDADNGWKSLTIPSPHHANKKNLHLFRFEILKMISKCACFLFNGTEKHEFTKEPEK